MADLADVRDTLTSLAASACYPNGLSSPSVTAREITLGGGWPLPADVDACMAARQSLVSIYPVPGAAAKEAQVYEPAFVVTAPVFGMSVANTPSNAFTVTGNPHPGEYLTVVLNNSKAYSVAAGPSDTNVTMAQAVANLISNDWPGTNASGGILTIAGATYAVVNIGAPYTMGQLIHRQRQQFRVIVFAPSDTDRRIIAGAIDVYFQQNLRITFSDTSQGIMIYANAIEEDTSQRYGNFRRQLIYEVCYGTIMNFTAYSVTSVNIQLTEQVTGINFEIVTGGTNIELAQPFSGGGQFDFNDPDQSGLLWGMYGF